MSCIRRPGKGRGLSARRGFTGAEAPARAGAAHWGLAVLALLLAAPAAARESLGVYERWGAFRDERPLRCFAIAEPDSASGRERRPYASVATWPGRLVRGQLHIRLSRSAQGQATLTLGGRRFALAVRGADAWAPNRQADAAIVGAMRSSPRMTVETGAGRDSYRLAGAATAIDAAALGCARRG